jgi:hypothetical protein
MARTGKADASTVAERPQESRIQRYHKRIASMREDRYTWEPHWRDIQRFISPRSGRWTLAETNQGRKKDQRIINGAPTQASKTLAAGMMSGLTSPARPWFRLLTPDPNLMEVAAVKQWLFLVEQRIRDTLARSNLYNSLPNIYRELGDYGTAAVLCEGDDDTVARFYPLTIGTYWLATDHRRDVDTLYRELRMTVRQVVDKFGIDKCSAAVRSRFQNGNYELAVFVDHLICPNDERDPGKIDSKNKPWSSCYWERGESTFLRERGYDSKPFFAPRWDVLGEDIYGSSPGMDALGDAKTLQVREKQFAMAVDKHIDPPLVGAPDLRSKGVNALPGAVTFANMSEGRPNLLPIYQVTPDYQGALTDKQDIINRIRDTYYANLFLMLSNSQDNSMTATEVNERHEEKLLALGPVLERLNNELLDPLIDRVFSLMMAAGVSDNPAVSLIPPPPPQLNGQPLRVDYISILAQSQKVLMTGAIQQFVQFAGAMASMNPGVLDKVDFDQALDEFGTDLGVPPAIIVSDDKVAAIRQQKQQQKQQEQMAAMAPAFAQYAKGAQSLSNANASPGSLLGAAGAAMNGGAPPA